MASHREEKLKIKLISELVMPNAVLWFIFCIYEILFKWLLK